MSHELKSDSVTVAAMTPLCKGERPISYELRSMTSPRIFAVGAAHLDRRGRVAETYVPAASNPGTMREEVGGGVFNALRNAVRHGAKGTLLSLRGGDLAAETVARTIQEWAIEDRSAIFLDRTTPSYTAILDANGDLVAGFADMGLYDSGFLRQLRRRSVREAVAASDAILCDANMSAEAVASLMRLANGKSVYAIAISPAKVVRLADTLSNLSCLFLNLREARTLARIGEDVSALAAAKALRAAGLARAVITQGEGPLLAFDENDFFTIASLEAVTIIDVTGAGDAVAGTTVAHLMRGQPLREAIRYGVAASFLTIQAAPVVAHYDDDTFAAALSLVGAPRAVA